jgi:hypothetical protein
MPTGLWTWQSCYGDDWGEGPMCENCTDGIDEEDLPESDNRPGDDGE